METLTLILSLLAISLSAATFYFSFLFGGKVEMTTPSQIWFGFPHTTGNPHVLLKTVLYATGKRGRIIERLYIRLDTDNSSQEFNTWVIGRENNTYKPGGLRINEDGYMGDHHFMLKPNNSSFNFKAGKVTLAIYGKIVNDKTDTLLKSVELDIPDRIESSFSSAKGIYFNFHSSKNEFIAELDK